VSIRKTIAPVRGFARVVLAALTALLAAGLVASPAMAANGLVAAYGFNELAGTAVGDSSGLGNNGTVANGTWSSLGKFGGALSFNGSSSLVTIPNSASLQPTSALTLEAWVNPLTVSNSWRDVIYKGDDNYYLEGSSFYASRPVAGGTFGGNNANAQGGNALAANTWSHLALTYDGATLRLYVNGTQVASQATTGAITTSTNPLQIGGDSLWGQYFQGLIDEVRVYNTALTAAQIQTDMTTAIAGGGGGGDTTAPSAPGTLSATAAGTSEVDLSWGAATDNVGVTQYEVDRCQGAGCSTFAAIGLTSGTTYQDTGRTAGTSYSYKVRAADAAGNQGPFSNTASATTQTASDTQAPSAPGPLSATAPSASEIDLSWSAATDNVGVTGYEIDRCQGSGCSTFAKIGNASGTTFQDTGLASSTSYSYKVRAADAAGNQGPFSNVASATTKSTQVPSGLVAAYAFNEGAGANVGDSSGLGNNGTVTNTTWAAGGKFGGALSFNGTNALVTIPNSTSLQLTTAMTLEAWVNPSAVTSDWRDVIYKGDDNYYLEGTSFNASRPDAGGTFSGANANAYGSDALAANTWSHLALTYDGTTLRLFVNGTQTGSQTRTGSIATSSNPLQIGGDSLWGQYFKGLIDEVRVYNTALTTAQLQADMTTAIGSGGTIPTAPANLTTAVVSSTEVDLNWSASTDSSGISGYQVERCQGTSCSNFAQIGSPTATSFKDTGLTANTSYSYRVRALNTLGSTGPYSDVTTAYTGLLVAPLRYAITPGMTEQYTASAPGGTGTVTWSVDGVSGGNSSTGTISAAGLYTAPSAAGAHTVTATSAGINTSVTVNVTDYAGTLTDHNDNLRTGQNVNETVLKPSNVTTSSFGKQFGYTLDGLTFASPLYVENLAMSGQGTHNVLFVATEHDSVYAFDADGKTGTPLWKDSFINPAAGVTPIPPAETGENEDIPNEIGITGTPVIDRATNTMYLVAATKEVTGSNTKLVNRLHALDITTGAEKFGGPVVIDAHAPGTGVDAVGGVIPFNNATENQRAGLLMSNGELYVAFANHGFNPPYHGWIMAYNPSTLHQDWVFCTTPNAQSGGVWMGGGGLTADSAGSIYFSTGNGTFDSNHDYGDTLLKLTPSGTVSDYFTPYNYQTLDDRDIDLASGGVILLPDQPGAHPHEVIAGGKGGTLYVVDRDNMGHVGTNNDNQIIQSLISVFPTGGSFNTGNYSKPTYFNGSVYYAPVKGPVMAFSVTNGMLSTSATSQSSAVFDGKTGTFSARGGETAASADGNANGIVWALQSNGDSQPGTLHAYDPTNLAHEYWNSDQAGTRDQLDPWLKFTLPLVANGHVYVASQGRLTAFGLLP
jgi:chitodextrinase